MNKQLTNLDVLRVFQELTMIGPVPTIRELGEELGIAGPSVQRRIEALIASGLLTRQANRPRTLAITAEGQRVLTS